MDEKKLNRYHIFFSCEEEWADQAYFWAEDQEGAVRQLRLLWPRASIKSVEPEEEGCATKEQERRVVERIEELVKLLNPVHPERSFVGAAMRGVLGQARANIEHGTMYSMQVTLENALRGMRKEIDINDELRQELAAVRAERDRLRETVDKQRSAPAGHVVLSGCTIGTLIVRQREGTR